MRNEKRKEGSVNRESRNTKRSGGGAKQGDQAMIREALPVKAR
jgi:hypothetical protein